MSFNNELFKASLYNLQTKLNGLNETQPTIAADMSKFKYYSFLQAYNEIVQFIYQLPLDQLVEIGDKLKELDEQIQELSNTVNRYTTKVDNLETEWTEYQQTINGQITNINTSISNINAKLDELGNLSDLNTTNKSTIVGAINELYNYSRYDTFSAADNSLIQNGLLVDPMNHYGENNKPGHLSSSQSSQIPFDLSVGLRAVNYYNNNNIMVTINGASSNGRFGRWDAYYNGSTWTPWNHFGITRLDHLWSGSMSSGSVSIPNAEKYNFFILSTTNDANGSSGALHYVEYNKAIKIPNYSYNSNNTDENAIYFSRMEVIISNNVLNINSNQRLTLVKNNEKLDLKVEDYQQTILHELWGVVR